MKFFSLFPYATYAPPNETFEKMLRTVLINLESIEK